MTVTLDRRALLGSAAAMAATPALAAIPSAPTAAPAVATSPVQGLWHEVVDLTVRMGAFNREIESAERPGGLPGWMYVQGEANDLGNRRYDALVRILRTTPRDAEDLATIARAAAHRDIVDGPRSYAAARLATATLSLQAA